MDERERGSGSPPLRDMGQYAGLGLQLAMAIGLFLWLGWKADGWLGTTPLLTLVGTFVGAGAGFYSIYRHLVLRGPDAHGPDDEKR